MGTGGGAYSGHTYSTALNVLGAAGFFFFFFLFQDSTFWTTCSAMSPHRQYKTQESRQSNAALWNSQVVSISSNISVSKIPRPAPGQDMSNSLKYFLLIALLVSFGLNKQPSYKQCIAFAYFLHYFLLIYVCLCYNMLAPVHHG